jgi:hypothetical protein
MSFWGAQVIVNLFSAIPLIGEPLSIWIRGDFVIGDATLNRFFSFHVIAVPLVLLGLVPRTSGAARSRLEQPGRRRDQEEEGRQRHPLDGIPFHPYYTVKDIVGVVVFLMVFLDHRLLRARRRAATSSSTTTSTPADPLKTPPHIAPVWYFTPYYSILRAMVWPLFGLDAKFWGVVAMGASVVIIAFLPWLDRSPVKSIRYRGPIFKTLLTIFVICFFILGFLGTQPPSYAFFGSSRAPRWRRLLSAVLLPVLPADALVVEDRQVQAGTGSGDDSKECENEKFLLTHCSLLRLLAFGAGCAASRQGAGCAGRQAGPAKRRANLRQLLPELPRRELRALQPPDRTRADRAADQGQPDVYRGQDRRADARRCARCEQKQWFGAAPPDLSLIARARASADGSGADWLYTYLRSFYRRRPAPDRLEQRGFRQRRHAARPLAVAGRAGLEQGATSSNCCAGQLSPAEYDKASAIWSVSWSGWPSRCRFPQAAGFGVLAFLVVLFGLPTR